MMKAIKIRYTNDDMPRLEKITKGDYIDLRSAEEVWMQEGDFALISLGVAMELPEGYEAQVVPRSSTFKNFGIIMTNSMGIIDESYCGNNDIWRFPAYATRNTVIRKNNRIAQFRIVEHQPTIVFDEVQELTGQDRAGFGSTGVE